jgi:hypothetical protein
MSVSDLAARFEQDQRASDYVRHTITMAVTGDSFGAAEMFANRFRNSKHVELIRRAAVDAGNTTDPGWASPLSPLKPLADAFVAIIRPRTILGRLQGLRSVPFDIRFPTQTAASVPSWTGEAQASRFSALAFDSTQFDHSKITGLVVISKELARSSDPAAEKLIQNDLAAAISLFSDQQLLDPSIDETDISPASITFGAPSVAASGTTADALRHDAQSLVAQMAGRGGLFLNPYWVMSPQLAISLGLLDSGLLRDGKLAGVPVLTTTAATADADSPTSGNMFLIDASQIMLADAGVDLDVSQHSTVQMDTAPDSPPTGATVVVSLWQRGLTGLRVRRFIRWQKQTDGAAGYITGANYGAA